MDAKSCNDEPTLIDGLERANDVKELGDRIINCDPPMVFGVHGDWGAGKTSFLQQIHLYLKKECPEAGLRNELIPPAVPGWDDWKDHKQITVVWFEAWRYQHEPNPIVALLQEIRTQLTWLTKVANKMGKGRETAVEAILSSSEDLMDSAGDVALSISSGLAATGVDLSVGEALAALGLGTVIKSVAPLPSKYREASDKWDREHYATQLPTHVIREALDQAIKQLIGKDQRLVILVDDLDRCESEAAYRLLEGIKIYLNIPSCVFVLGMDQKLIELAVRKHTEAKNEEEKDVLAREYVEKIVRNVTHIPAIVKPGKFLIQFLEAQDGADDICTVVDAFHCLPANPRKIKAFAHTISRFMDHVDFRKDTDDKKSFSTSLQGKLHGQDGKECRTDAGLLVVMACLYQFHYEIYRILESDPKFYSNVLDWARGKETGHSVLAAELPEKAIPDPGDPTETSFAPTFRDPMRGDVFRVQTLVRALDVSMSPYIKRCLLGREKTA